MNTSTPRRVVRAVVTAAAAVGFLLASAMGPAAASISSEGTTADVIKDSVTVNF